MARSTSKMKAIEKIEKIKIKLLNYRTHLQVAPYAEYSIRLCMTTYKEIPILSSIRLQDNGPRQPHHPELGVHLS